jgi:hypothetical protein
MPTGCIAPGHCGGGKHWQASRRARSVLRPAVRLMGRCTAIEREGCLFTTLTLLVAAAAVTLVRRCRRPSSGEVF